MGQGKLLAVAWGIRWMRRHRGELLFEAGETLVHCPPLHYNILKFPTNENLLHWNGWHL